MQTQGLAQRLQVEVTSVIARQVTKLASGLSNSRLQLWLDVQTGVQHLTVALLIASCD